MTSLQSSPLFINSSAPAPFAGPSSALHALFFPVVHPSVVPQLVVLSVLLLGYLAVNVTNVVLRLRQASVSIVSIKDGHICWSTSLIHCLFLVAFLVSAQAQVWVLVRMWHEDGSYEGIYVARGLSWSALVVAATFHVLGLALASGFSTSTSDPTARGTLYSNPSIRRLYNFLAIILPIVFGGASLGPAVAAEVACRKPWHAFLDAERVAREGDAAAAAGEDITIFELRWAESLLKLDERMCVKTQRMSYIALLVALCIIFIAAIVFYVTLSRKLQRQAALLRSSATKFRVVELAGLCAPAGNRDRSVTPERGRHVILPSVSTIRTDETHSEWPLVYTPSPTSTRASKLPRSMSRSPTPLRHKGTDEGAKMEARARSLEAGLCSLRCQVACLLLAAAQYIANSVIILYVDTATQSDPFWAAFVNLWALWIYAVFGGPASIILVIVGGLNPHRQSLLGIPIQTFRAPIFATTSSTDYDDEEDDDLKHQVGYGGPFSQPLPLRKELHSPGRLPATMLPILECDEVRMPPPATFQRQQRPHYLRPMDIT